MKKSELFTINGETYSLKDWAKKHGLYYSLVRNRVKVLGWTLEKALITQANKQYSGNDVIELTLDGISKTITEWSKETGLAINTIKRRIKNGLTVKQALTMPQYQRTPLSPEQLLERLQEILGHNSGEDHKGEYHRAPENSLYEVIEKFCWHSNEAKAALTPIEKRELNEFLSHLIGEIYGAAKQLEKYYLEGAAEPESMPEFMQKIFDQIH